MSVNQRRKLYSVWLNDEFDTLVAIDLPADQCARLMGVPVTTFRQYLSRGDCKKWVIIKTGKEEKKQ